MSCSSDIKPLQFTFQNITLTDDGRAQSNGIAIQIGTPPQTFSLTPTVLLNNSFVNNIATCGSESNTSCISIIGGGYDASASSTFVSTTSDAWNGSAESNADALLGTSSIYFNDVLTVASQKLPGFPLLIEATGVNLYAGLGLGKNSTFIGRLLEADLVPSHSWSLYPGMYSDTGAGSLIIGGYADRFYTGELHTKNITDAEAVPNWQIASMEYQTETTTVNLLPDGSETFTAIVDPYYPILVVPDEMLWKWGNATNGTWSPEYLIHTYSANNVPTGNITVTLANGLKTTIPNNAIFDPPAYDNGILATIRNASSNEVYSMFEPWDVLGATGGAKPQRSAVFGIPYAAMVYMVTNWEDKQFSIANANQAAQIGGEATAICGSKSSKKGGGSSNTGAIAGGVVGGVVGLALIAILAWFLWRRKRRNAKGGATAGAANVKDPSNTNDVNGMLKAELPQYNSVDHKSPAKTDDVIDAPVQEMPAQSAIPEMPGTQKPPPKELPAEDGNVIRSELPA